MDANRRHDKFVEYNSHYNIYPCTNVYHTVKIYVIRIGQHFVYTSKSMKKKETTPLSAILIR